MKTDLNKHMMALCMRGDAGVMDRCIVSSVQSCLGDDLSLPILALVKRLAEMGVECHTPDMFSFERYDSFLFYEMPEPADPVFAYAQKSKKPMFVIIVENHFVLPRNADYRQYEDFSAVFTYNDDPVSRGIAHKLNYVCSLNVPDYQAIPFSGRKLATMVSSYIKPRKSKPQLCSYMRLKTIKFYENLCEDVFDLYGYGWDVGMNVFQDRPKVFKYILALKLYEILPRRKLKTWRGTIDGLKRDVVCNYRFAYCYENTTEIPGYITEKIFDVMMAGAVPIYLGHSSTSNRIPKECYIDRADFRDDAQLYDYISKMPEEEWRGYLEAAHNFLLSKEAVPFSVPHYVKTVTDVMLPKLGISQADNLQQGD